MNFLKKMRILNSNSLKLLAALLMAVDHIGMVWFPFDFLPWRAIGRLSMPLFAFAIAEGCRYTRNKIKHFFMLFILGTLCQIVYIIFDPSIMYFGILFTFSFSILCIYALQNFKQCLFDKTVKIADKWLSGLLFVLTVFFVYAFCYFFQVDYGFWGCMLPVFISIFDFHRIPAPDKIKKLDVLPLKVLCAAIGVTFLVLFNKSVLSVVSPYAFLSIPILLLYNGKRGKRSMKYFFYIFYPLHLGLIQGAYIVYHWIQVS